MHLAAGLRSDPLGKVECSPRFSSRYNGEGKGKEGMRRRGRVRERGQRKGGQGRERGGKARFGYLSRGPKFLVTPLFKTILFCKAYETLQ